MATNKSSQQCWGRVKLCGQDRALLFTETKTADWEREIETWEDVESEREKTTEDKRVK